jgi:hypothetical protein
MRALMLAAIAGISIGATLLPKDRAAIMYYSGRDSVLAFLPSADSANAASVFIAGIEGDSVPTPQLAGRPCIGLALFSRAEMAKSIEDGKRPEDLRPRDAAYRLVVYGATGSRPMAVHNLVKGRIYEAIFFDEEWHRKAGSTGRIPLKGTIERFLAGRNGGCTAE